MLIICVYDFVGCGVYIADDGDEIAVYILAEDICFVFGDEEVKRCGLAARVVGELLHEEEGCAVYGYSADVWCGLACSD